MAALEIFDTTNYLSLTQARVGQGWPGKKGSLPVQLRQCGTMFRGIVTVHYGEILAVLVAT
jgi:hypothetical protein